MYWHLQVHIILGIGDFEVVSDLPNNMTGVMADVGASPNDPVFLDHHTMVDCILEEWLQEHPDASYPDNVPVNDLPGRCIHRPFLSARNAQPCL